MISRYRLTAPIPAIHHAPEGAEPRVTLPAGALLVESVLQSTRLGMVDMYWERRHFSAHRRDLFKKAELVSAALAQNHSKTFTFWNAFTPTRKCFRFVFRRRRCAGAFWNGMPVKKTGPRWNWALRQR
jgi:hypothetical protein